MLSSGTMEPASRTVLFVLTGVAAATWIIAVTQLGSSALVALVFTAPGAVIGLTIGWLSHAFIRREYTWGRGLISALTGAVILAPWLAAAVVVVTGLEPENLLLLFIAGAWIAALVGMIAAVLAFGYRAMSRWRGRRKNSGRL